MICFDVVQSRIRSPVEEYFRISFSSGPDFGNTVVGGLATKNHAPTKPGIDYEIDWGRVKKEHVGTLE